VAIKEFFIGDQGPQLYDDTSHPERDPDRLVTRLECEEIVVTALTGKITLQSQTVAVVSGQTITHRVPVVLNGTTYYMLLQT
jgi:hypothetical protein